jgi:hypothetical protein
MMPDPNQPTTDEWIERIEFVISSLMQLSILAVATSSFIHRQWATAFSGVVILLLTFVPAILERQYRVRLPIEVTMFVCGFLFASYVLGEVADFYEQLWWWDLLLHGSSAIVTGLIGFLAVYAFYITNRIRIDPFYLAAISFGCAVTVGTLWEVFEYLMDLGFGLNMQRSGLTDTMTDLMVNGLGAFTAALVGYYYVLHSDEQMGRRLIQRLIKRRPVV